MSLLWFVVDNSFIVPNQYDNACMSEEIRSLNQETISMYDVTKLKADILLFSDCRKNCYTNVPVFT